MKYLSLVIVSIVLLIGVACTTTNTKPITSIDLKINNQDSNITINQGDSITLSWAITNAPSAPSCDLFQNEEGPEKDDEAIDIDNKCGGTKTLTPQKSTLYTIRGSANQGGKITDSLTVILNPNTTSEKSLTIAINGSGAVTSSPAGIDCGSRCSANYAEGTTITLTARPASGFSLLGWTGDCTGSQNTCTLTLTEDSNVGAVFTSTPLNSLAINKKGLGTVTSSPAGIDCGESCSANFPPNTTITVTARPASGFEFIGWTGDCTSTQTTCTFTITEDSNIGVVFNLTANLSLGKSTYDTSCSSGCHGTNGDGIKNSSGVTTTDLADYNDREEILEILTTGSMRIFANLLTPSAREAVADYVALCFPKDTSIGCP